MSSAAASRPSAVSHTTAEHEQALRVDLVKGCKILHRSGMDTMAGHLSVRLDDERILIKPRPASWNRLEPSDLIIMDLDGNRIDGGASDRTAVLEWPLHTQVYRARPDVNSVLHAHPRDSTLFGALGMHMEPLTRETYLFTGKLPVHENLQCILCMSNTITTAEMGDEVAEYLGDHAALLLRYHGTLVATPSIGQTCAIAYDLEVAAKTMLNAAAIRPQPIMDPAQAAAVAAVSSRTLPTVMAMMKDERWQKLQDYFLEESELGDRGARGSRSADDQTATLRALGIE